MPPLIPQDVNIPELLGYDLASLFAGGIVTSLITAYILYYFTNKGPLRSWMAYLALGVTYFITLSSLFLIAVDLATGLHAIAAGDDISGINVYFVVMWRAVYWSIQVLAWVVIPLCQSYVLSGELTFLRRLRSAVLENVILYGACLFLVGALIVAMVVYVIVSNAQKTPEEHPIPLTFDMFVGLGMSLSNSFGLLLLTGFLGYGLVELPRYLWRFGNNAWQLQHLEFRAAKMLEEVEDADDELLAELMNLESLNRRVAAEDPLRKQLDIILKRVARDMERHSRSLQRVRSDLVEPKRSGLVRLNKRIVSCQRKYRQAAYRWEHLQNRAFFLEDVIKAKSSADRRIECPFRPHPIRRKLGKLGNLFDHLEWLYMVHLRNVWNKILAVVFVIYGIVLLWCQLTAIVHYFSGVNISVFFYTFKLFLLFKNKFMMQALSIFLVVMTATIAYFGLFRIKFFTFYQLVPHHSDVYSLLFNGMIMCRVVPTLLFNYVSIVGLPDLQGEGPSNVAFVQVMGTMRLDQLEFFGQVGQFFADFFPLIIPVISLLTFFDIIPRLASLCGVDQRFVFNRDETKLNNEAIIEGKELLRVQRHKRVRNEKTLAVDENEDHVPLDRRFRNHEHDGDDLRDTIEFAEDFDLDLQELEEQLEDRGIRAPSGSKHYPVDHRTSGSLNTKGSIERSSDNSYLGNMSFSDDDEDDEDDDVRLSKRTKEMLAQMRSGNLF